MKCPNCGHDAEMHWYPGCPGAQGVENFEDQDYPTTACRDCLPRKMYPVRGDGFAHDGMCTWTRSSIEAAR